MRTKKKEELRSNLCVRILLGGSFVKQQYTVETCVVSKKKEPRTLKERKREPVTKRVCARSEGDVRRTGVGGGRTSKDGRSGRGRVRVRRGGKIRRRRRNQDYLPRVGCAPRSTLVYPSTTGSKGNRVIRLRVWSFCGRPCGRR